jgi:hypothetical protein
MNVREGILPALAIAALVCFEGDAGAQSVVTFTPASPAVFDSVDSYSITPASGAGTVVITGVLHGDGAPKTANFYEPLGSVPQDVLSSCERQLLVAINRPGRFSVTVEHNSGSLERCTLTRLP